MVTHLSYKRLVTSSTPFEGYCLNICFFPADFAEHDVAPKKRFSVVVNWKTSFHRRNRPAEKSFWVIVQQQTEGLVLDYPKLFQN